MANVLHGMAYKYRQSQETTKADELDQYVLSHWPSTEIALWAQVDLVKSSVDGKNYTAAQAGVDNLLADFANEEQLVYAVFQIADEYCELNQNEKAEQLYQYVIDNQSNTEHAIWAKASTAMLNILLGNEATVKAALDILVADFNDHPDLPQAVFTIGEEYYYQAFRYKNEGRDAEAKEYFRKAIEVWEKLITELPYSVKYTPQAYYYSALCYSQEFGEHDKAIEYYQKLLDNWPDFDYRRTSYAWLGIACCYEKLEKSGRIPTSVAAGQICRACNKLLTDYPDTNPSMIQTAQKLLKKYQVSEQ
jgi:tetratricopeptide (TPR) repeat protein